MLHIRKLTWRPEIAIFEAGDTFKKTIIFGIYVKFRRGKLLFHGSLCLIELALGDEFPKFHVFISLWLGAY